MQVRCTAEKLIIRALPGGLDTSFRLRLNEVVTAVGQSFDGAWLYVYNDLVAGWAGRAYLQDVSFDPLNPLWIGAAEGNYRNYRPGNPKIDMIVIHVIEGTLKSADNWFNDKAAGVSAHYGIGLKRELHQYVKEEHAAYHAGRVDHPTAPLVLQRPGVNPNNYSIGIEHEGTADGEWPGTMYEDSAVLVADICARRQFPVDRTHVVGHHEIYSLKTCPGRGDVDRIVRMAQAL